MATRETEGRTSHFFLVVGLLFLAGLIACVVLVLLAGDPGLWRRRAFDLGSLAVGTLVSFTAVRSQGVRRWILSMRVGVIVLVILGLASLLGVIFTQNASPGEYIDRFGRTGYRILDGIGVLRVFHVWWYKGLLLLLTYLVTACSLRRARTLLRIAFTPTFHRTEHEFRGAPVPDGLRTPAAVEKATEKVTRILSRKGFRSASRETDEGGIALFATKGRFSRLGTLALHLSLVFILGGGYITGTAGFRYLQWASPGQTFGIEGVDFEVRVDSFSIETTPEGRVKDYLSDLTVLEDGREVLEKTIEVNVPLKYGGINIYQSSYRGDPRKVEEALFTLLDGEGQILEEQLLVPYGEPMNVPGQDLTLEILDYASDFVVDTQARVVRSRSRDPRNPAIKVRYTTPAREPYEEWLFLSGIDMHRQEGIPYRLRFIDFRPMFSTGLEVASQPALILVWIGFVLMTLGATLSLYLDHRRLWVLIRPEGSADAGASRVYLGGSSNRDQKGWTRTLKEWGASIEQAE